MKGRGQDMKGREMEVLEEEAGWMVKMNDKRTKIKGIEKQ